MIEDYRVTEYCNKFEDILNKKANMQKDIKENNPRIKNMYINIRDNSKNFKKTFMDIYNNKCSYCGVSIDIIPKRMFEIDHFIKKSGNNFKDINSIENLVLSCQTCNRYKLDFDVEGSDIDLINPDNEKIKNVFKRDDKYNIKISDEFIHNQTVISFYNKLKLHEDTHRLDFLLMELIGFEKNLRENHRNLNSLRLEIKDLIDKLKNKRNMI